MKYLKITSIIALALMLCTQVMAGEQWTKHKAKKWVASREWANGVDISPYKGTDMVEFAKQYHKQKVRWEKAFAWIATHNVAGMLPGKYEIDGTHCYANVQDAKLKPDYLVNIESHKNYIDLQWTVTGIERFGIVSPKNATIKVPYKSDVMFWNTKKIKYVDSDPNTFFLFFPTNYHRACVLPEEGAMSPVRKVCIKIEYDKN